MKMMTIRAADVRVGDEMWNSSSTLWRWVRVKSVSYSSVRVTLEGGVETSVPGVHLVTNAWSTTKVLDEAVAVRR